MKSNNHIRFDWNCKRYLNLLKVFYFCSLSYISAGQNVDSLKTLLDNELGPMRQHVLFELAYYYTDIDNRLAISYINQATKLNVTYRDSLMIVKCGQLKALLYRRFDKMDSSLMLAERILPIAERNKFDSETKKILNGVALIYTFNARYDEALAYYIRILDILDPEVNKAEASVTFNNIGLVYFKLEDMEKALFYFKKSLLLKEEVNYTFDLDNVLVNISSCYAYLKDYAAAKAYNESALNVCKTGCSKATVASAAFNFGLIAYGHGQFDEAIDYFKTSYGIAKESERSRLEIDNLFFLLKIFNDTGEVSSAQPFVLEAERIFSSNSFYKYGLIQMCKQLTDLYQKMGNDRKVAYYQGKYIHLKDSVYSEALTTNLMKVEAAFLERENRAKLAAQGRVLELRNDIIARQKVLNIVAGVVAILLISVVLLLNQNIKQKRRTTCVLEQKVKERTLELENKHYLLLKSMQERNIEVQRMSSEIRSSLATIKGLGVLVFHDLGTTNASNYLARIEETSNNLIQGLNRVHDQHL